MLQHIRKFRCRPMSLAMTADNSSKAPWADRNVVSWKSNQEFFVSSSRFVARPTDYVSQSHPLKFFWSCLMIIDSQPGRWSDKTLVTIIRVSAGDVIDASYLKSRIGYYLNTCDVFTPAFLHCVEFLGAKQDDVNFHEDAEEQLKQWGTSRREFTPLTETTNDGPPPGPYVVRDQRLCQVWRVYDDHARAFLVSTWPSEQDPRCVISTNCITTSL
jgi:hypothetical protein